MSDTPIYDKIFSERFVVCGSRGPRIGEEGNPRCMQRVGHAGFHRGFKGSGFEHVRWGAPVMRDMQFVEDCRTHKILPER